MAAGVAGSLREEGRADALVEGQIEALEPAFVQRLAGEPPAAAGEADARLEIEDERQIRPEIARGLGMERADERLGEAAPGA